MNNNFNSWNNNSNFEALDILSILGFIAQMTNIEQDKKQKEYIHQVIRVIGQEIAKLHIENERIETKLDMLLTWLNKK